jgi:putative transposase
MGEALHPWQDVDYVLLHFGVPERTARQRYFSCMESRPVRGRRSHLTGGGLLISYGSWAEVRKLGQRIKGDERILGDSPFVQSMLSGEHLSHRTAGQAGVTFTTLVQRIGDLYHITLESLRSGSRRSHLVEARSLFCFWAVRQGGFPMATVAAFLTMSPPGAGYAVERGEGIAREKGYAL